MIYLIIGLIASLIINIIFALTIIWIRQQDKKLLAALKETEAILLGMDDNIKKVKSFVEIVLENRSW